jgi:hypothetical protein
MAEYQTLTADSRMLRRDRKSNNNGDDRPFGEDVRELSRRRHMKNLNVPKRHMISNEVKIYLDVLGPLLLNQIHRHVYSVDVVTEDNRGAGKRSMKLLHKLEQPTDFSDDHEMGENICNQKHSNTMIEQIDLPHNGRLPVIY